MLGGHPRATALAAGRFWRHAASLVGHYASAPLPLRSWPDTKIGSVTAIASYRSGPLAPLASKATGSIANAMKAMVDPDNALGRGLAAIRAQFQVPESFPPAVLAAADEAANRSPPAHVARTAMRFVTLVPASLTDLDQAFAIDVAGTDLLLHYAIADVAWFVDDGGAIDVEAWNRGETLYLPDGTAPLYPPVLSQGAASLHPAGPRRARGDQERGQAGI